MEKNKNNNNYNTRNDTILTTFEFPIGDIMGKAQKKNIPLSDLPSFQGMVVEDPDKFLFKFDVLCGNY